MRKVVTCGKQEDLHIVRKTWNYNLNFTSKDYCVVLCVNWNKAFGLQLHLEYSVAVI